MGATLGRPWFRAGLFVAIATSCALAGCSPFGASAFTCETDEQCGAGGRCEELTKLCSFPDPTGRCGPGGRMYGDHAGPRAGDCASGDIVPVIDAPTDAPPPAQCMANEKICFGPGIETCKANGQGYDPAQRVECALACDSSSGAPRCLAASLIPVSEQLACSAEGGIDLQPQPGAEITIRDTEITCNNCAGGVTSIPRRGTEPNNWFCLRSLVLPAGMQIQTQNSGPVSLFVTGTTQLEATFNFAGRGPGSFAGANGPNDNNGGSAGQGPCAGQGGARNGGGSAFVGGGGGGAGGAGTGGNGGDGRETVNTVAVIAEGGDGGPSGSQCDAASAIPLRGGSGGGSGGDGSCGPGVRCGGSGGAGGGAIHIASRTDIVGNGSIDVSGGSGQSTGLFNQGGGGGGGAGGAVLLESKSVALGGSLVAKGGDGGNSGLRGGGDGGDNGGLGGGNGRNANSSGDGGSGAGGAAGRIRINSLVPASCGNAQPQPSCSTGPLPVQ